MAAMPTDTIAPAHNLDYPIVGSSLRNQRFLVMNHTDGWRNGWRGGGRWAWTVLGLRLVILLAVPIGRATKK